MPPRQVPTTTDPTTFARADKLRRDCETLVRELTLALERALMSFEDPKRAGEPFLTRLGQLERDGEALGRAHPALKAYLTEVLRQTRVQVGQLLARADAAHRGRGRVDGRFQESYNRVVGPALGNLPSQGTTALRSQVERGVRQLVDQVVPPEVPGDARGVMTRELTTWALQQPAVEDAFFVIERTLSHVARFLHEKLTIHGQLVALKDETAARKALTGDQAKVADERAGALARRSNELDELIRHTIEQQATSIRTHVRLNPKLVLDPTRRFLERLDASAGITIKKDQVKIDLGARVQITNPLMFNNTTQLGVGGQLGVQVGNDLHVGASYDAHLQNGQLTGQQFKVSLSWRF